MEIAQRMLIGMLLIGIGSVIVCARGHVARGAQESDRPFKALRQGRGWLRFLTVEAVLVGLAIIGMGIAVLAGAFAD